MTMTAAMMKDAMMTSAPPRDPRRAARRARTRTRTTRRTPSLLRAPRRAARAVLLGGLLVDSKSASSSEDYN